MTRRFSFAEAERRLGPTAIAAAQRSVDAAPPVRQEVREQVRAVFASARLTPAFPASKAA